ncbi:MAG TPA: PAS domain S-box protein [Opitutaceae bacterium]
MAVTDTPIPYPALNAYWGMEGIADAVIATDERGHVSYLNPSACKLTGWIESQALGVPADVVFGLLNESERTPIHSVVASLLSQELLAVPLTSHVLLLNRSGGTTPIEYSASALRSTSGSTTGTVLVFRDVSTRRAAELTALRLAAIINGSDDAIVGKNLQGIVTDWNPGAERLFGYAAEEMIGQSILKLLPPDRQHEETLILSRLQRGERVDHFETVRLRKDGSPVDVSLTISPIRDREGKIIGASKIARNVTELRAAQSKLQAHALDLEVKVRERSRKLEETVAELEAFNYSLSHDMRAPLRAIQSFSEIVIQDYGDRIPEGVELLRKVVSASARLDRLIQDVLAFARLSRTEIILSPVDVGTLLEEIIQERPELQVPAAKVLLQGPFPPVVGHDASLTQCLTNLLHNAVKFVAPGVEPIVEVFPQRRGSLIRLCVRDNGIGIDEQGRRKLFALFERLATDHPYQGTGVGLAIVHKAVERMKGTVGVDSTPGQGSTFWIELPAASTLPT